VLTQEIIDDIDCMTDTLNSYLKLKNNEDTITIMRDFINTLDEKNIDEVKLFNNLQTLIYDIVED